MTWMLVAPGASCAARATVRSAFEIETMSAASDEDPLSEMLRDHRMIRSDVRAPATIAAGPLIETRIGPRTSVEDENDCGVSGRRGRLDCRLLAVAVAVRTLHG
jgi:hypothetical protein